METLKALILTIIVLNLVSKGFTCFTAPSYLQDSLQYNQFIAPFIDSSSRPEVFLLIS